LKILRRVSDLRGVISENRGFVPTMGALHEGHLALVQRSVEECDITIVSLFVNPTQFGPNEDFERYPRDERRDAELVESVGADILFAPTVDEIYPRELGTSIHVPEVTELWEGAVRPGHFNGVATVVAKLFNIVRPNRAYFGQKDFQQCAVIKRMVEDLNMEIKLSFEPTVREKDGLALSSRNRYLSADERSVAPTIYQQLKEQRLQIIEGMTPSSCCENAIRRLSEVGFIVDYFAYVDNATLRPLDVLADSSSLICAAKIGKTRLIDNIQI